MKSNQRISIALMCLTACTMLLGCNPFALKSQSSLLEYLGYIPDEPEYRTNIYFGDAAAWYRAWGIAKPGSFTEAWESDYREEVVHVLPAQTTPPDFLFQYAMFEDVKGFFGFDIFSAKQYLTAGQANRISIVDLNDNLSINEALTSYGYTSESMSGGMLYLYGEDNIGMNPDSPSKTGQLTNLNRIHLDADRLIITRNTDTIQAALDSSSGKIASLSDNPIFQAAAEALEVNALSDLGELVGVIVSDLEYLNKLFDFDLAAFATYHKNDTAKLALILVLPKGQDADNAADVIAERLQSYKSRMLGGATLEEAWTFESAQGMQVNGLPVAVVVMHADVHEGEQEPLGRYVNVWSWFRLVLARDLGFLETLP